MIAREQWDYRPEWLAWVYEVWQGGRGRVQQQYPSLHPCRMAFVERATRAFEEHDIVVNAVKTWVSIQKIESGDDWCDEYPHVHYPLNATTLVHYLQPSDDPALLEILDGDEVIETIKPERGLTVFMPNSLRHGVRKHHGNVDRVQLIATALR